MTNSEDEDVSLALVSGDDEDDDEDDDRHCNDRKLGRDKMCAAVGLMVGGVRGGSGDWEGQKERDLPREGRCRGHGVRIAVFVTVC